MALIQRYRELHQGAMVITGNALVLSPSVQTTIGGPPNAFATSCYTSTIPSLVAGAGYPNGTTLNPTQNSSSAILNMPSGSEVKYAELFWYTANGTNPNKSITFVPPTGAPLSISPNLARTQTISGITWQSVDVAAIINARGSGTYTVGNVDGPVIPLNNTTAFNTLGWALIVVYKNQSLKYRYFNVNTGFVFTGPGAPSQFNFTGFVTPSSGPVTGYLFVTAGAGDINDGTQIFAGATQGTSVKMGNTSSNPWNGVAPFAFANTILPGNILIADGNNSANIGLLDTTGTFGTRNCLVFNSPQISPPFTRVINDILGLNISSQLTNNQSTLFTQIFNTGGGEIVSSQSVQVDINAPTLSPITKTVDKEFANIGDTLTYTISFGNTGNLAANNVTFLDTIPIFTSFISGSAAVNSVTVPQNPQSGILIGTVPVGSIQTITFKVLVSTTIANTTVTIPNTGNLLFSFSPGGTLPAIQSYNSSNTVTTTVPNYTDLSGITKAVDKSFATVGDIINYTVTIPNTGVVSALNVIFKDTIPNGTSVVPNTFIINGVTTTITNPISGVNIGTIAPGAISTITFSVVVGATMPNPNPVTNSANVSYIHSSGSTFANNSNIVSTQINAVILSGEKVVNKNFANIGDVLTYTIPIANTGNLTANNILFLDSVPNGTSFVAGSFKQDGVVISGTPNSLVTLPNSIKDLGVTTITFQVTVNTTPSPNPIPNTASASTTYTIDSTTAPIRTGTSSLNTNTVNTQINFASLGGIVKFVNKSFANCGDSINYTIVVPNSGTVTAQNVVFKDTIPNGTLLILDSVFVNGVVQSGGNPSSGVTIPNIAPGTMATLTFSVRVTC